MIRLLVGPAAALAVSLKLPAQHQPSAPPAFSVGAQAVLLLTHLDPALRGRAMTEGYLTQPMVMAHASAWEDRLRGSLVVNFEGATLDRGELNPGVYGESYVDRRHPHTLLHEAMLTASGARVSLSAGKGFVPFGTDDPMVRPFVKYPANHHLAQILERVQLVGALRWRSVAVEAATFNGDEPEDPYDHPNLKNFGDSWAARLTLMPRTFLETQASMARVESPENSFGVGLDQRKFSGSVRYADARGAYGLAEVARTDDLSGTRRVFAFWSVLVEGQLRRRGTAVGVRLEQTIRPEEERLPDVYRTPRPLVDNNIVGRTRWRIASASASRDVLAGRSRVTPFAEGSLAWLAPGERVVAFDPAVSVFGASRLWSISVGVKLSLGTVHHRMGRYGVADPATGPQHHHTQSALQ